MEIHSVTLLQSVLKPLTARRVDKSGYSQFLQDPCRRNWNNGKGFKETKHDAGALSLNCCSFKCVKGCELYHSGLKIIFALKAFENQHMQKGFIWTSYPFSLPRKQGSLTDPNRAKSLFKGGF